MLLQETTYAEVDWHPDPVDLPAHIVKRFDGKVTGPAGHMSCPKTPPLRNRDQPREAVALNRAANVQSPTVRSAGALRFRWYVLRDMDAGSDGSGRSDSDSDGCGPALPHASRC